MKARSRSFSTPRKHSSHQPTLNSAQPWTKSRVLQELKALADPNPRAGLAYFGIDVPKAYGISAPILHKFARHIGKNQKLAEELWASGIHDARILAALIGEPGKVTPAQMERIRPAAISTRKQSRPGKKPPPGAGAKKNSKSEPALPWLRTSATKIKRLPMRVLCNFYV
jgi:hypothetical protein